MPVDDNLRSYARAHLLRSQPDMDRVAIDEFVDSRAFATLAAGFDRQILRFMALHGGKAAPGAGPAEVRVLKFPTLVPPVPPLLPPAPPPEAAASVPDTEAQAPVADVPAAPPPAATAPQPIPPPPAPMPPEPEPPHLSFRLPGARAGEPYAGRAEPQEAVDTTFAFCGAAIPPGLDMTFDAATGQFTGTPASTGDFAIAIDYAIGGRQRTAQARLIVNADPKTMWRNLPSDETAVYWKPDEACGSVVGEAFRIVAASKRGRSHAHVGSFRDDDYAIATAGTGWHIGIVSDGAGSAKFSRQGAALICDEARQRLADTLQGERAADIDKAARAYNEARASKGDPARLDVAWQSLRNALYGAVGVAAYYAAKRIMDEAASRKDDLQAAFKDYSSTALIAVCKRYDFGILCAAYWVGDGAVGIYDRERGITLLGDVDSGEFSGQTRFLDSGEVTQEALIRRTRFALVDDMTALVLMTDGVSDPRFETEARLAQREDWHALWSELEPAIAQDDASAPPEQRLLAWLDFWSQGNHDDRTIALIY